MALSSAGPAATYPPGIVGVHALPADHHDGPWDSIITPPGLKDRLLGTALLILRHGRALRGDERPVVRVRGTLVNPLLQDLDLRRPAKPDQRSGPLFDKSTHTHAAARKPLQRAWAAERVPVARFDLHRTLFRPLRAEIEIGAAPAHANR